jgi:xanthine dehydrogenase molybdopterin-binding subunit B
VLKISAFVEVGGKPDVGDHGNPAGAIPCLMNAIADALASVGVPPEIDMPATPEKVWRALNSFSDERTA